MYFGIDLGTTNTLVCMYNPFKPVNNYSLIPISYPGMERQPGESQDYSMESVAYRIPGQPGGPVKWLVGRPALDYVKTLPDGRENENFYENTKAGIPNEAIYNNNIRPEEVIEEILYICFYSIKRYLIVYLFRNERDAEQDIVNAYIGISTPLSMNPNYNKSIHSAGMRALERLGISRMKNKQLFTYEEPQAALQNFLSHAVNPKRGLDFIRDLCSEKGTHVAMVVDLGGGTSDIAVRPFRKLDSAASNIMFEFPDTCIGKHHHNRISAKNNAKFAFGGMDFDDRLTAYIVHLLNKEYKEDSRGIPFLQEKVGFTGSLDFIPRLTEEQKNRIKGTARELALEIKKFFSDESYSYYETPHLEGLLSENDPVRPIIYITREEYRENVLAPLIEQKEARRAGNFEKTLTIEELIHRTYKEAGITDLKDIDFIYLTGGMSNVVEIRRWLEQHVNHKTRIIWAQDVAALDKGMDNCLLDICFGIGRAASFANTFDAPTFNRQRIANDILLDVGDSMQVLVRNGTACPHEDDAPRTYPVNTVVGIPVRLYWGKGEYDSDLTLLGQYRVDPNSVIPKNTEIKFHYYLDENKQLTLTAEYYDLNMEKKTVTLSNIELK